ncbi:YlxR family protein [Candidatus Corynebacterium faecigallinarum]|uniref:YlxR family protein n=1 Tax=Candidatus Corynebacterium faecigallinarum TaxID=2838528 RepID=UPI003FD5D342
MSTRPSTPSAAAGPKRTCIATRNVLPDSQLLRCVVQRDGHVTVGESGSGEGSTRVVPDPRRRLPGRGAWITATRKAYETAVQRRAFARALNVPAETDTSDVLEYITGHGAGDTPGTGPLRRTPTLTTSPVAEKEKETDY